MAARGASPNYFLAENYQQEINLHNIVHHQRVYTFTEENPEQAQALQGAAYWIRDRCDEESARRVIVLYSFGPNRSRDSSRWELLGDDIGVFVMDEPNR